jgi:lipopolysaccharide/colanic/teichoic acid biosynthesis glycosyltransferase
MYEALKRILDLGVCVVTLPIVMPLGLVLSAAIALTLGRPVIFTQERIGLDDRPFRLRKFRTMRLRSGRGGPEDDDANRMTSFGSWLRAASLDELPTLWNVIRGDMSLVGPRPLLPEYLPLYSPTQRRRHEVKPGVTGWAQVNGRNTVSWDERFALDVWYVDHRSTALDLKILAKTLATVLSRQGVSAEGHATMPPFTGSGGRA